MSRIIDLQKTDLKTALKIMMAESGTNSLADLARNLNIKETTFRSAISNGSIRLLDFVEVAISMGYTVTVKDKSKGE